MFSLVGLAFLQFLSGPEIDFDRLRGRQLGLVVGGFVLSFVLALITGFALRGFGQVDTSLLVAIILVAISLGVVVPVLKDSGRASSRRGQLVIAAGAVW